MCHTLLQYYIHCNHTNVAFILCDDKHWYPNNRTDGLTIEFRDHSQRRGVAHSYRRKCPSCVAVVWEASGGQRLRGGVQAWRSFARTPTAIDLVGVDTDTSSDDDDVVTMSGAIYPHQPGPNSDVNPTGNRRNAGVSTLGSTTSISNRAPPSTAVAAARQTSARPGTMPYWRIEELCRQRLEASIPLFPGLENWPLDRIDMVVRTFVAPESGMRPRTRQLGHRSEASNVFLHFVHDCAHGTDGMWNSIKTAVRDLAVECCDTHLASSEAYTTEQEHRLEERLLVLEWLLVFLHQYKLAHEEHDRLGRTERANVNVVIAEVLESAWERYQTVTGAEAGSRVPNAILRALAPDSTDRRQMMLVVGSRGPLAGVSPGLGQADNVGRNTTNLETIVAQVPAISRRRLNRLNPMDRTEANPPSHRTATASPPTDSNEPVHAGHSPVQLSLKDLHKSLYHGSRPLPHQLTSLSTATRVHQILIYFEACSHYNAVHVAKPTLNGSDVATSRCGCRHFPPEMLSTQRALSPDLCLVCRWADNINRTHTGGESENEWKDVCFGRLVRMVDAGREIALWPFGAEEA